MTIWLALFALLVVIAVAGALLSRYGDAIAEKRGLSRSWVGLALIATVTSLPELATGVSSVTVAQVPNIAVGDVLGSCVFNLLILVLLDFLYRREPVYTLARQGHVVSAGFGTAMIAFVGFNLMLYGQGFTPAIGHVGVYAPMLVLMYALAMRTLFRYERAQVGEFVEEAPTYPDLSLRQAVVRYVATAVVVVAAGVVLPFVGGSLAEQMGWGTTFVGTLFIAAVTSAPEIVVTVAALRIGAIDMAMGNVLGSNLFNVAILAIDEVFYTRGVLFADVSDAHVASVLSAAMMGGLAITGLVLRPRSRVVRAVSWVSVMLLAVYLLNVLFLYLRHV